MSLMQIKYLDTKNLSDEQFSKSGEEFLLVAESDQDMTANQAHKFMVFSKDELPEDTEYEWIYSVNNDEQVRIIRRESPELEITVYDSGELSLIVKIRFSNKIFTVQLKKKIVFPNPIMQHEINMKIFAGVDKRTVPGRGKVKTRKPRFDYINRYIAQMGIRGVIDDHIQKTNLSDKKKIKLNKIILRLIYSDSLNIFADGNKLELETYGYFAKTKYKNQVEQGVGPTGATLYMQGLAYGYISLPEKTINKYKKTNWKGFKSTILHKSANPNLTIKSFTENDEFKKLVNCSRITSLHIKNVVNFIKDYCNLENDVSKITKGLLQSCFFRNMKYPKTNWLTYIEDSKLDNDYSFTSDKFKLKTSYKYRWGGKKGLTASGISITCKDNDKNLIKNGEAYGIIFTQGGDSGKLLQIECKPAGGEEYPIDYQAWSDIGEQANNDAHIWKNENCIIHCSYENGKITVSSIYSNHYDNKIFFDKNNNTLEIEFGLVPIWAKAKKVTPDNRLQDGIAYPIEMVVIHHLGTYPAGTALWKNNDWLDVDKSKSIKTYKTVKDKKTKKDKKILVREQHRGKGNSVHYILRRNGEFIKLVHESQMSNHAGTPSSFWGVRIDNNGDEIIGHVDARSIGLETEHFAGAYTSEQYDSFIKQIEGIKNGYDIKPRNVVGHDEVGLKDGNFKSKKSKLKLKNCPSTNFDWRILELAGLALKPNDSLEMTGNLEKYFIDGNRSRLTTPRKSDRSKKLKNNAIKDFLLGLGKIGYKVHVDEGLVDVNKKAIAAFRKRYLVNTFGERNLVTNVITIDDAKKLKAVVGTLKPEDLYEPKEKKYYK